jgi:hypothetical protein
VEFYLRKIRNKRIFLIHISNLEAKFSNIGYFFRFLCSCNTKYILNITIFESYTGWFYITVGVFVAYNFQIAKVK